MMLITILTYLIKFYLWGCIASCTMFIAMVICIITFADNKEEVFKEWFNTSNDAIKVWFLYTFLSYIGLGTALQVIYNIVIKDRRK